jgi:hypothetical protein
MSSFTAIESNSIRCSTVRISCAGVSELQGTRIVTTIPKEQIRQITLSHLTSARWPFLQFFLGFVSVTVGLILGITSLLIDQGDAAPIDPGSFVIRVPVIIVALWMLIGFGLWLLVGVFRGKYILLVETEEGERTISFDNTASIGEILRFIEKAKQEFDYEIRIPAGNEHASS